MNHQNSPSNSSNSSNSSNNNMKTQDLIEALNKLPDNLALTPVSNKAPKIKNWQKGVDREIIIKEIQSGRANGFGLITGELSGYVLAIDCDGPTAHELAEKLGGLPYTVSFTSGKEGRAQYLYSIPKLYRETLKNFTRKVLETGTKEQLELRYNSMQSVLPPSVHPETQGYIWTNSIENTPIAECPIWVIEQILDEKPEQPTLDFTKTPQQDPIPLIQCLSREHREWVASGTSQGGRNSNGAELARDVIGTESRLQYLGISYSDSARDLFDEYCDHCNPSINDKEREAIWNSAIKSNPTPCLSDDKLENCYKAWTRKSINTSKPNYQTSGDAALKPEQQSNVIPFRVQQPQLNIEDIEDELRHLLEQNLSKSKQQLKINELATKANVQPRELQEIYNKIQQEQEQELDNDSIKPELDELLENQNQSLDTSKYLPGNLNKISDFATRLCLRPELGLTILYTTISSLLKVGSKIRLSDYTDFDQPMGLYSAIVAEPSQRKSPLINAIATKPLRELQKKAKDEFKEQMKQYELDMKDFEHDDSLPEPIKPTMRRYYINSGSGAGMRDLINAQSKNSWGLAILSDEISGHFKSQKKSYNIGQTEDLLSYYDGFGKIDALKDSLASDFDECLVSILGGIQPKVIREFNDGSDDNGGHSRFNFVNQPTVPFLIPENPPGSLDLLPLITSTYEKISELPQLDLRLSPEAKKHFEILNNKCETYRIKAKSQALAALWGKMPGKIGRFAALIHVVERVASGQVVDPIVEKGTLIKAAKLAKFYFKEAQNLYAGCGDELAPQLVKILELALKRQNQITARDVKQFDWSFKKSTPDDIRGMFTQLVGMGHGFLEGSGSRLKFSSQSQKSKTVEDFENCRGTVDDCRGTVDETVDEKILQPYGFQTTVDVVEENQKNDLKSKQTNNRDEATQYVDVQVFVNETVDGKKTSTTSTNGCNPCDSGKSSSTVSSTVASTVLKSSTVCGSGIQPEPIDFDKLKVGDILFDKAGNPHQITRWDIPNNMWQTHRKDGYISRDDIMNTDEFHRATVEDIAGLMPKIIAAKNKVQAKWLCDIYGGDSTSLMALAFITNPEGFCEIYEFDSWD
ncbi:hypothetical protein NIES204_45250 (plasmid) [Planktothrix agardhii NIES-204]|nr:hypothetical protein NIES204_45250 [Planktothrix agardhii NIES-204]